MSVDRQSVGSLVKRSLAIVACASVCAAVQTFCAQFGGQAAAPTPVAAVQSVPAPATASATVTPPRTASTVDMATLLAPVANKAAIPRIHLAQAKLLHEAGKALFIDSRTDVEYDLGHLPGALPDITLAGAESAKRRLEPFRDRVLVTYCQGTDCELSVKAAETLFDWGNARICIFFGGWEEWKTAGYPVETGRAQPN